jgi:hypothetical protein
MEVTIDCITHLIKRTESADAQRATAAATVALWAWKSAGKANV